MPSDEWGWRPMEDYINHGRKPKEFQEDIDRWVDTNHQARGELRKVYDKGKPLKFTVLVNDKFYEGRIVGWALQMPHIHVDALNQAFEFSWMSLWRAYKENKTLKV